MSEEYIFLNCGKCASALLLTSNWINDQTEMTATIQLQLFKLIPGIWMLAIELLITHK